MPATLDHLRAALPHIPIREEGRELIASPASTEEVSALLTHCNTHGIPVEITGARTKRTWSGIAQAHLLLDITRLNGVREHPWQDLTATVAAGTPWADMQRTLAANNQFVALDPLWPERATVGGVLATNDSGALRLRYGSARDLVIGMTLVLADGTVAKTGGKVVKNVAGYDLHKLMIGAFGTLAVITEVTFRLHPLPQHRAAWSISSPAVEPLARLIAAITTSHLNPEGMQIRMDDGGFTLDVLLAAAPEVLRDKGDALATMAAAQQLAAVTSGQTLELLDARQELSDLSSAGVVLKIATLQTEVPAILARIRAANAHALAYPLGIIYTRFRPGQPLPPGLRSDVQQSGGTFLPLGDAGPPTAAMREIKHQFDPNRILNRGLMGGI